MGATNAAFSLDKRKKKMVAAPFAYLFSGVKYIYEYIKPGFNTTRNLYLFLNNE